MARRSAGCSYICSYGGLSWRALTRRRVLKRRRGVLITPSGSSLGGSPNIYRFLCALFRPLIFVSLIPTHNTRFWPRHCKGRTSSMAPGEKCRSRGCKTDVCAKSTFCNMRKSLRCGCHPGWTRELPRLEPRAISMLISCIDTCAYPIACNNLISWPRSYCETRRCSPTEELEDDSLLTLIFSDACAVQSEKLHCGGHIWAPGMSSCKGRKFPWTIDWAVLKCWLLCPQHRSVRSYGDWRGNLPFTGFRFWVYPLLWPWVSNIRNC